MNRTEAIKKVWNLVEADKIKEAEEAISKYQRNLQRTLKRFDRWLKSLKHRHCLVAKW